MVETLGIIIDRCPKERLRKMESQTIEKIGYIPILNSIFDLLYMILKYKGDK